MSFLLTLGLCIIYPYFLFNNEVFLESGKVYQWKWNSCEDIWGFYPSGLAPTRSICFCSGIQKGAAWAPPWPAPPDGRYRWDYESILHHIQAGQTWCYISLVYSSDIDLTLHTYTGEQFFHGTVDAIDGWQEAVSDLPASGLYYGGSFFIDLHLRDFVERPEWQAAHLLNLDQVSPIRVARSDNHFLGYTYRYTRKRDNSNLKISGNLDRPAYFAASHGPGVKSCGKANWLKIEDLQ